MSVSVFTGWRTITPGRCFECGSKDEWQCDGRGNVQCACQACPDCGIIDAYGVHEVHEVHEVGCIQISDEENAEV